ncbi:MAG: ABC transporter ATP-binding protein [Anaerolineae bacterium]|nr:ABC transporter ATP-binding protein [Anaerolineae bacterium]
MGWHGGWFVYMRGGDESERKAQVSWRLIRRVLGYARPYRRHIVWMLLTILVSTGLSLLTPLIFRDLIDHTLPEGDTGRLNMLALGLVLIPVANGAILVVQRLLNASIGEGVIYDLRVALYAHLQRMSLRFFTHTKTGELISRLNNDVIDAQRAISNTIVDIVTNVIQVVAILAVMFTLEWRLTLLGLLVMPGFIVGARRLGFRLRDIAREAMDHNAQMNAIMNETLNIGGVLLVKLFGRIDTEVDRFDSRAARVRDIGIRRAVVGSTFFVMIGLVATIGTALVYWVGGHLVLRGAFTIGTIVAFSSYLTQLYGVLQQLTNAPVAFATSMVSFERVFEVIDLPLDIKEKPGAIDLTDVRGELTFEQVTFEYSIDEEHLLGYVQRHGQTELVTTALSGSGGARQGSGSPQGNGELPHAPAGPSQARELALDNVSFSIQPGQLVALVGPSGAGKTTLTYLIPRLYDPNQGRILLDGHDLRDASLASLAAQVGMVTQETHLFHDTFRTNLLYARLDATQDQIEAACRAANIHDFITALPDGYDTIVGERGYRLSGGEKQRIAIARVILKDPRLLVLDEATSHLDSQSEALIQDALTHVMTTRTSIVIAHRLSTILAADLILVIDRGQIVERGTHTDLLAQGGLYAGLYETQFSRREGQPA